MSINENIIFGDQNFVLPVHMNYGRYVLEQILKHEDKICLVSTLFTICLKIFVTSAENGCTDFTLKTLLIIIVFSYVFVYPVKF